MISALISRLIILAFGTLYPAYSSYKAVRTRDVKEYVKWMMYWIVFALFTFVETFTDVLFSFWFPFYYEFKVAIVFWLLSPATKGSSFLYRNFVHPALQKRENEIDDYLAQAKERGYSTVMQIGSKGMTYATNMIVQTALKGGGGIMDQLRKSYSLSDLAHRGPISRQQSGKPHSLDSSSRPQDTTDSSKDERRSSSKNRRSVNISPSIDMYFPEVEMAVRHATQPSDILSEIRSSEDISSGYSSTDQLYGEGVLTRASSVSLRGVRGRSTSISTRQTTRRTPLTDEFLDEDDFYPGEDVIVRHPYHYYPPQKQIILDERQYIMDNLRKEPPPNTFVPVKEHINEIHEGSQNELEQIPEVKDSVPYNNVSDKAEIEVSEGNIKQTEEAEPLKKISESSRRSSQSSLFSDAAESVDSLSLKSFGSSNVSIDSSNDPNRGGRYKKLKAPPVPPCSEKPSAPELAASIMSDVSAALNLNTSTPPIPRRSKESDV